jgi:soluble lytic murein transglycosylase-like protein
MIARALIIGGVSYLAYVALKPGAASASVPADIDGAGVVLRREDNGGRLFLAPNEILAIINANNLDGWHDPRDVLATITIESGFNPAAYRYEAHLRDASYGLMQVLWSTAREMDPSLTDPAQLYDPETNIRVGMLYQRWTWDFLRRRLGRDPTEAEWLSGYNMGVGNVLKGRIARAYVEKHGAAKSALQVA